jgi:phosphatidate phosphatase APP1
LFFIPEKGFSVITDIDDTVKISEVLNRDKLIQNTFFKKFQAVSGMSQLYHHWSGQNAAFHYVSGSPWQLYPFLEKFLIDNDFPIGTMHLKNFRFKISKLIQFLQADQLKFKMEMIESIIEKFPRRHFIFVGDSGEKDPEVYAALGRKYPEKVKLILIRDAGNLAKDAQRIRKVFPADFPVKWFIFHQAEELIIKKYHLLENLL